MSFLTPLYLLGALAVSLPILFHMIRRTPRGRMPFSSTMFLEPSPPRITRRSRIENWFLLLLRALAVCLLALAFARPFLRETEGAGVQEGDVSWRYVLIDTSASTRRECVQDERAPVLDELLDGFDPRDHIAVATFDQTVQERVSFEQSAAIDPTQRRQVLAAEVEKIEPTWRGTDLGRALLTAAEMLTEATTDEPAPGKREVIVVSDLQQGSDLTALQAYTWPENVTVRLVPLGQECAPTNAGLSPVVDPEAAVEQSVRVRVSNAADSKRETFRLQWPDDFSSVDDPQPSADAAVEVYVPPGQSRVVRVKYREAGHQPQRVVLSGDDQEFDNTAWLTRTTRQQVRIVYLGSEPANDPQQMRFFVEPIFSSTPRRDVTVIDGADAGDLALAGDAAPQLVIVTSAPAADQAQSLRTYMQQGGTVLFVTRTAEQAASMYELAGTQPMPVTEADVADYVMLTDIDFRHPVLAPFGDPRYSDFTKLHFWQHRIIDLQPFGEARVLARFETGPPALAEVPVGRGRMFVFASGWHAEDSQLAVWSKFVPLMNLLLEYGSGRTDMVRQYAVGEAIDLAGLGGGRSLTHVRTPDGTVIPLPDEASTFTAADRPGIYRFQPEADSSPEHSIAVPVNLAAAESRTAPFPPEVFEGAGVILGEESRPESASEIEQRERQLQNSELESRQKIWRWLVTTAIAILLLETMLSSWLAGRRTRQTAAETN
ncbi:MAG: BatA domain-containing protein [Maioricimonas sp. JB049]